MKHVVQFSGGKGSTVVAKMVIDQYGHDDVILMHHDTKAEDHDTYRFIQDVSKHLKHPVTDVSDGRSLWELVEKYGFPSQFMPFCTEKLKQIPAKKFLKSLKEDFILYNGFSFDEYKRVIKAQLRAEEEGNKVVSPLFEHKTFSNQLQKIILSWGICLPNAYRYLSHNNCIPCYKGGESHWYKVWRYYPEEFNRAMLLEEKSTHTVFKDKTLRELSRMWARGYMPDLFGDEGIPCMCAG
jgi:3'-phosphoadenosine 5'-phosphosulfate sulfotransferase (PAPS reductase)/FAD synthetase